MIRLLVTPARGHVPLEPSPRNVFRSGVHVHDAVSNSKLEGLLSDTGKHHFTAGHPYWDADINALCASAGA